MVNYSVPSVNGVVVDVTPGESYRLFMRDGEFNSTVYEYIVPYPEMLVPRE